jgi:hypothetical protein
MHRRATITAVWVIGLLTAHRACADWKVWTVSETRRVLREDPPGRDASVSVAAARNEWRSFQVLMRSDFPKWWVSIEPGDLAGPGGASVRGADARLFRQHQFHVTLPTYRNQDFRPGWYPDALIPTVNPLTGKSLRDERLAAMPFSLPAGQTHGFLVDLYVPGGVPAGEYRGTYRVTAVDRPAPGRPGGSYRRDIEVKLTVWDFDLPPTPTLQTALGTPAGRLRGDYEKRVKAGEKPRPIDWETVEAQCNRLLSEHRLNAVPASYLWPVAQADGTFAVPQRQIDAVRACIDRYHVNAVQVPHPEVAIKDPVREPTKLAAWLASLDGAIHQVDRPQVVFYIYLKDEPNTEEEYRYVQKWGRSIRALRPAVKILVVEQPRTQDERWGNLYGAVDIWCPLFSLFEEQPAKARQALGEILWTYTALCQGNMTPWWHTDFPLLHYRVPSWIAWRYRIRGLLYWGGMSFWDQVRDPWSNPKTYSLRNERQDLVYNGEGSLVYPGYAVGYEGIAPSLRLKALRDSVEDYEYLAILERQGRAAEAEKIVLPLAGSWYQWEKDPAAYDRARARLARLIVRGGK